MTIKTRTALTAALAVSLASTLAACSKAPEPAAEAAPAAEHGEHAADAAAAPALVRLAPPAGATVEIVSPKDGDTVTSPFTVVFGITGMTLAPAGTQEPNTGHHHLLVDADLPAEIPAAPIPNDEHHLHFGKAQTETTLTLPPGQHTLQLVLGDYLHIPFDPLVASPKITVTVAP